MRAIINYFPAFYLLFNGLLYCLLAAFFVVDPLPWFERLNIVLADEVGYTELRAMYIGLMATLGLYFLAALVFPRLCLPALCLALLSYASLACARSLGIFVDGLSNDLIVQLWWIEIGSCALAGLAIVCLHFQKSR
mgnify:CR=1 FL=1